jgi:predicted PurR-regulated permease PerM
MAAKRQSNSRSTGKDASDEAHGKSLVGTSRSDIESFDARLSRTPALDVPIPDAVALNKRQRRALVVAAVVALIAGFVLIRGFFTVIALSLLMSVIFHPLYARLNRRLNRPGTSAMLTVVLALLVIIIPFIFIVLLTIGQVQHYIYAAAHTGGSLSVPEATTKIFEGINKVLDTLTRGSFQITAEQFRNSLASLTTNLANSFLGFLTASVGTVANFVTQFILFMYLLTAMLAHGDNLQRMFRSLNPLGNDVSSLYLSRTAQMARGAVGGQFLIAACQGFAEAAILYIAGIHYFFFFGLVLSSLSVVPLGGGIVAIPIGILELLAGNIWQGVLILLGHFFVITNIDNVLRPRLIPKSIRMNSALMMLAVFGGIDLFGFLGIAIGPIIMILVLSTLQVYLPLARANQNAVAYDEPGAQ